MKYFRVLPSLSFIGILASVSFAQFERMEIFISPVRPPQVISQQGLARIAARQTDGSAADLGIYMARAYFAMINNDQKTALANYNSAIGISADNASLYMSRANVYANLGETENAEADRRTAINLLTARIEKNALDPTGYVERGLYFGRSGDLESEMADYDRAIELGAGTAQIYFYRGTTLLKAKEYERALDDLNRAAELGPRLADIFKTRASLYHTIGDLEREQADTQQYFTLKR
jgi:tetratricopeptide (TPR) repeat protein